MIQVVVINTPRARAPFRSAGHSRHFRKQAPRLHQLSAHDQAGCAAQAWADLSLA
jgi:hypothetical protein